MRVGRRWCLRVLRVVSLVLFAVLGTSVLMRLAPGYFSDAREMDAQHAAGARAAVEQQRASEASVAASVLLPMHSWMHGDLGRSRQFDVPVSELLRGRAGTSTSLLLRGVLLGWLLSLLGALVLAARRTGFGEPLIAVSTAVLLAVPAGALATFCLVSEFGGPVFVLAWLVAARDFKLLYRMLRQTLRSPQVFYARAQGLSFFQIARIQVLRTLLVEMLSLTVMSFVVALSALVPVEVIFDTHGLGQLAWTAAMNRDLPVLLAVTAVVALATGLAALLGSLSYGQEAASCV